MNATAGPRDRIVTPDTDPGRWTPAEEAAYRAGRCPRQVSDGGWGSGEPLCREPSEPGASFGHCREHSTELLAEQAGRARAARLQQIPDRQDRTRTGRSR